MKYFPTDIIISVTAYLEHEIEILYILKLLRAEKYYTSKMCHDVDLVSRVNYKIDKIVIKNIKDLKKIDKTKIKGLRIEGNEKIDGSELPLKLTRLVFGNNFNHSINNLPDEIIYLKFGKDYNQRSSCFPKSLIHIEFGWNFNQSVDNLPENTKYIFFAYNFNQKINNLPKSIIHLRLGMEFNQTVNLEQYKNLILIEISNESQFNLFINKSDYCNIRIW